MTGAVFGPTNCTMTSKRTVRDGTLTEGFDRTPAGVQQQQAAAGRTATWQVTVYVVDRNSWKDGGSLEVSLRVLFVIADCNGWNEACVQVRASTSAAA